MARATLGLASILIATWAIRSGSGPLSMISAAVIGLVAAAPLVDGFFLTLTALAQSERRIGLLSAWRVAGFALVPLLLLALYRVLPGLPASAIAFLLASAAGITGFLVMRGRAPAVPGPPPPDWGSMLVRARPFLFLSVAALSYGRAEVAVIGLLGSPADGAFYHAAYQVVLLVFSLSEVVFTAVFADLYRANADPATLARSWPPLRRALMVVVVVALPPLWVHAGQVMMLLGGEDFSAAGPVLQALLPMVAMLPLAAAMNFLMLLNHPETRAAVDTGCVLTTVALVFLVTPPGGAVYAAVAASTCYAAACAWAWWRVAALGLRLRWVKDAAYAVLITLPAALALAWDWPYWWMGAVAFVGAALALLYAFRYLRLDDLRELTT